MKMRLAAARGLLLYVILAAYLVSACGGATPSAATSPSAASSPSALARATVAAATATPVPSLGKVTIATGAHVASLWPITIADGAGFFKAEGLDAEVVVTQSGTNTLAAVAGGSAQFGGLPFSDAILATQKGQPLVSAAVLVAQFTTDAVISTDKANALGITASTPVADRLKKAKGIKIAVTSLGGSGDKLLRYVLKQNGLDADKDFTIVGLGSDAMVPAFRAGQIDAYLNSSPVIDQGIAAGGSWWFRPSQAEIPQLSGFLYTTLIARPDYVKQNPKVADAVVRALLKALALLRNDETKSLEILAKYVQLAPDLLKSSLRNNVAAYSKDGLISDAGFKQNVDFLVAGGQAITLKFDDVATNEVVKRVSTP